MDALGDRKPISEEELQRCRERDQAFEPTVIQIGRIARLLAARMTKMQKVLAGTNTEDNVLKLMGDDINVSFDHRIVGRDVSSSTRVMTVDLHGYIDKDLFLGEDFTTIDKTITFEGDAWVNVYDEEHGGNRVENLTLEQARHVGAGILWKIKTELDRREEQYGRTDRYDDFIEY